MFVSGSVQDFGTKVLQNYCQLISDQPSNNRSTPRRLVMFMLLVSYQVNDVRSGETALKTYTIMKQDGESLQNMVMTSQGEFPPDRR